MAKTREEAIKELREAFGNPSKHGGLIRIPKVLWGEGKTVKELCDEVLQDAPFGKVSGSLLDEAAHLLKEIEFSAGHNKDTCPCCREQKPRHWSECRLKRIIKMAEQCPILSCIGGRMVPKDEFATLRAENEALKRRLETFSGLALCGTDIVCKQCGRILVQGGNYKHVQRGTTDAEGSET